MLLFFVCLMKNSDHNKYNYKKSNYKKFDYSKSNYKKIDYSKSNHNRFDCRKQNYFDYNSGSVFILFVILILFTVIMIPCAMAFDSANNNSIDYFSTDLREVNAAPNGAVLLIVDGMGSYYLFPELKGETLTNETVGISVLQTMPQIWENGFRISEMEVPVPVTEKGHSVIVTGNPNADAEMVGYSDSTFMDVLHSEGFLCIGVMQRGDFESMRKKFDVIIYDKTNSVNNMDFTVQTNSFDDSDPKVSKIVNELATVFESQKNRAASYTNTKDTSEKYAGYNRWGLDTAYEALTVMEKYPDQKFVLVINAGAVDSTGHYRGYYAYLDAIERLDKDLEKLFEKCRRNNLFFLLTADHGMAFEELNKKGGGHSSAKYAKTKESLHIPFVIYGNSIRNGTINFEKTGQEDIAPTLLSLLNIPAQPRFSKGNILPAKEMPTLYLRSPEPVQIQLYRLAGDGEKQVFNSRGFKRLTGYTGYSIAGLEPGSYLLQWETDSSEKKFTQNELRLQISADTHIDLLDYVKKSPVSFLQSSNRDETAESDPTPPVWLTKTICFLLIGIVNIAGVGLIYSIYKKEGSLKF